MSGHIRIPRAALDLCANVAEKGALLDLYSWADDRRYRHGRMAASDLQTRWGLSARRCERLLSSLVEEGLVDIHQPGTNRRARQIRVLRNEEYLARLEAERSVERNTECSSAGQSMEMEAAETQPGTQPGTPTRAHVPPPNLQPPENNSPLSPPKGEQPGAVDKSCGSVDRSIEQTPAPQKPTRKKRTEKVFLSLEAVLAEPIPEALSQVDGYADLFAEFAEYRITAMKAKGRFTRRAVELFHSHMLKALKEGCSAADFKAGFEHAIIKNWLLPYPRKPRHTGPGPKVNTADAWNDVVKALRIFGARPPYQATANEDAWCFDDDETVSAAFDAGVKAAAEAVSVPQAWQVLYRNGGETDRLWQQRRFTRAYKAALTAAPARLRGAA